MSPPSAPIRATRVGQRLLGDLLEVGVDRENHAVALRRRGPGAIGDSWLWPFGSLKIVVAPGIPRRMESSDSSSPSTGLLSASTCPRIPCAPCGPAYDRIDRGVRVHAAQRHRRRRVDGKEAPGENEILARRVDRARDQRAVDVERRERATRALPARAPRAARSRAEPSRGFARALGAWRRGSRRAAPARCALGRLLTLGARAPVLAVHQLDAARLHENGEGEQRERCVREADSPRANHAWHGRLAWRGARDEDLLFGLGDVHVQALFGDRL